jgi:protein-arginine kinase activator protein McsA
MKAEIVPVRKAFLFEPHFRSKAESDAIRRCMTAQEKQKWTIYFDRWGCLACGQTRKRIHAGNGFCSKCHNNISGRLRTIVRNLSRDRKSIPEELHEISAAVSEAEHLLGPLPRRRLRSVLQEPIEAGAPTLGEHVG